MKTKRQRKGKKSAKPINYFNSDTEAAIIEYNNEPDSEVRNNIYRSRIEYAFNKLAENLIHSYKFYNYDNTYSDFKHEIVAHFIDKIDKFDNGKGKAFSYFTRMGINFCIINNTNNYKSQINKASIDENSEHLDSRLVENSAEEHIQETILSEFLDKYIKYCEDNLSAIFIKRNELAIAEAVLELFKRRSDIEIFDKKVLYMLIREMTDASTQEITKIVNILKKIYKTKYQEFLKF